jgi:hypothetical protein
LRWELVPGFHRTIDGVRIAVNSSGMRGPEAAPAKGDRIRVAILVNSIHPRVPEAQTFPRRLERILRSADPRFEVFAIGVDGYDTLQEVTALEQRVLALEPDAVVACFRLSDIGTNPIDVRGLGAAVPNAKGSGGGLRVWRGVRALLGSGGESGLTLAQGTDPYGSLIPPASSDIVLAAQFKRIAESQAFFASASSSSAARAVVEAPGRLWLNKFADLKNIGKIRFALGKLETMAHAHGFRVLIVIVPFFYEVDGRYLEEPAHRIIRHEARLNEFPVVDLLPAFRAAGFGKVSRNGVELSPHGHVVLAKGLFRALRKHTFPDLERGVDGGSRR